MIKRSRYGETLLRSGFVKAWNAWRQHKPNIRPDLRKFDFRNTRNLTDCDLSGAFLSRVDLAGVCLKNAKLSGADLSRADLKGADLREADLTNAVLYDAELNSAKLDRALLNKADLHNANLKYASLEKADLTEANLSGANLHKTNLESANLTGADCHVANFAEARLCNADLSWANFSRAILRLADLTRTKFYHTRCENCNMASSFLQGTLFYGCKLNTAEKLDSAMHLGPSSLDRSVLIASGTLPVKFLRGVGFTEWEVEMAKYYRPKLRKDDIIAIAHNLARMVEERTTTSFDTHYIAFVARNFQFADTLRKHFHENMLRCWFAPIGEKAKYESLIVNNFQSRDNRGTYHHPCLGFKDKIILVLSRAFFADKSVEAIVKTLLGEERRNDDSLILYPVSMDDAYKSRQDEWLEELQRNRPIIDFSGLSDGPEFKEKVELLSKVPEAYKSNVSASEFVNL